MSKKDDSGEILNIIHREICLITFLLTFKRLIKLFWGKAGSYARTVQH